MFFKVFKPLSAQFSMFGMELIWVILAQVFTLLGGLAVIKILSNLLSESEFGVYSLALSISGLLVAMLFLPLGQIYMRFLAVIDSSDMRKLYRDQKRQLFFVSLVSLLIMIPSTLLISKYTNDYLNTFITLTFLTIVFGYQTVQQFLMMTFRLRVSGSAVQMIGAIVRPLFAFLAMWFMGYSALHAILGVALGFMVLSVSQYIVLNKYWLNGISKSSLELNEKTIVADKVASVSYFSYGFFHSVLGIVSVVILSSDRWLLSVFGTVEQVAIYAVLMQIALAPTAFAYAIVTRFAAPIYFASRTLSVEQQNRRFMMILGLWSATCFFVLLVTAIFHHFIVELLTQKYFAQYSYLLPWMVFGFLVERSAQILELRGALALKTNMYLYNYFMIILLVPLLEYIFYMMLGFDGLTVGLVFAAGVSFISVATLNKVFL